ncbi:hypothetical protein JCM10914A_09920 [Paenibacillus sp. JCM 10914]|uniref:glycosyltransferase family 4 protein n=1 Tax=Paenibacillus sp. JCM 10914 TaxID=1236974 RepID=UPI0003CCA1E4|nr:glycosyltransferase family 4 protein [Paenibacillus sp. JCM 10914]GAE07318.1 glycosyl transferase, group 1 [Paenibacillus sp. JCM 10914]
MKIVIIGPYPPPLGGISIHIQRVAQHARRVGLDVEIIDDSNGPHTASDVHPIQNYTKFLLRFPWIQGDLFHFHTISKRVRMLLGLYAWFGKKIVLTVHGESLMQQIQYANSIERYWLLNSLKSIHRILCVNERDAQKLVEMGFSHEQVMTLPAYIPPLSTQHHDDHAIPDKVIEFLTHRDFTIAANGYIRFYRGGELYGADQLITLLQRLRELNYEVRVLFALMGVTEQSEEERAYYEGLKIQLQETGLAEFFMFYEVKNTELHPILQNAQLFIRPTLTDGYGVSIAEALACGIPAVASDVCLRPEGALLYSAGSVDELLTLVVQVIEHYASYQESVVQLPAPDYLSPLLKVYEAAFGNENLSNPFTLGKYGE